MKRPGFIPEAVCLRFLGTRVSLLEIERFINQQVPSPEIAEVQQVREIPSIIEIKRVCAEYFGLPPGELKTSRRGSFGLARNIAIYMCRTVGGYGIAGNCE